MMDGSRLAKAAKKQAAVVVKAVAAAAAVVAVAVRPEVADGDEEARNSKTDESR